MLGKTTMIDLASGVRSSAKRYGLTERLRCGMLVAAVCALSATPAWAATAADSSGFSQANRLLFMTDHLANVDTPSRLNYTLEQKGGDDEFKDHVDLAVDREQSEPGKHVRIDYLSGDRKRFMPEIDDAHGNPVIMMFLQHDVVEMAKRTGGSWRYFQKRIKLALAHGSTVTPTRASYQGGQVDARKIVITPFENNREHREDLGKSLGKRYMFTLSDAVPGGVVEIRADTPQGEGKQAAVEKLKFQSVERNPDDKAPSRAAQSG